MSTSWSVGDKVSVRRTFTQADVRQFAEVSGDKNPAHLDEEYMKTTPFGGCIVHGMLVSSLFSALIAMKLPGAGSIYLAQQLAFKAPVRIGEEVEASVEIVKAREDKPIVTLRTQCVNSRGETVIEGEAVVKAPAG